MIDQNKGKKKRKPTAFSTWSDVEGDIKRLNHDLGSDKYGSAQADGSVGAVAPASSSGGESVGMGESIIDNAKTYDDEFSDADEIYELDTIGGTYYLIVNELDGYIDFTYYDENLNAIDGGQIDFDDILPLIGEIIRQTNLNVKNVKQLKSNYITQM